MALSLRIKHNNPGQGQSKYKDSEEEGNLHVPGIVRNGEINVGKV